MPLLDASERVSMRLWELYLTNDIFFTLAICLFLFDICDPVA